MAENRPTREFGKRRPQPLPLPPKEPVKRSGHVALLVMGTIAVGTTAYALMPRQNCDPPSPGMAAQPNAACSDRSWSGGSGSAVHHYSFFSGDSSSHSSSSGSSDSGSGGVTRGGFGSFAHAFGFSGRG